MEITLKQAAAAFPAMTQLAERELALQVSWDFSLAVDAVKEAIARFEQAAKKRAKDRDCDGPFVAPVLEHGAQEDPSVTRARLEHELRVREFNEEFIALQETTKVELPDRKFKLADLGDKNIKPSALMGVKFLFEA